MKHIMKRHKFTTYIKERFFLRFHMSLILTATALSGLLATKVLLLLNVKEMLIRYPLAVVFSYLVFFALIKIWLLYIYIRVRSFIMVSATARPSDSCYLFGHLLLSQCAFINAVAVLYKQGL